MSNYAIIESGSKQYRVEPKGVLQIEKLELPEGQKQVSLDRVLFIRDGEKIQVGNPTIAGATVLCDCVGDFKAPKVVSFKFRRRKASRRIHGHRQHFTRLIVREIKAS